LGQGGFCVGHGGSSGKPGDVRSVPRGAGRCWSNRAGRVVDGRPSRWDNPARFPFTRPEDDDMPVAKWNESGRVWEEDHGLLDTEQVARCERADVAEPLPSPVPTRMISNGEYMPVPQTDEQKRVEARVQELAEAASRKLGISRRQFLAGSGGMAASLLAMNEVYGAFFNVSAAELYEQAARVPAAPPKDLFVFDDQLHFVRGSRPSPPDFRPVAPGPSSGPRVKVNPYNARGQKDERGETWGVWNPALVGLPIDPGYAHITQFIKDVYLDSQVTIGLLSNVTASIVQIQGEKARAPRN